MSITESWQFWALLSAAFAAATAIFSKLGLRDVDPDAAQLVRTIVVVIALALAITALGKTKTLATMNQRTWAYLIVAGLGTAASWACYFRALKIGDAARVAAVDKLSVVMVAVVAALALNERLSPVGWIGVAFAGLGAFLISWAR